MGFKGDSEIWARWHRDAENIPCSICRDEAVILISGIHDLVNIKTDKPVFNEKRFRQFRAIVEERWQIFLYWKRTGSWKCPHHVCN